MLNFVNGYTKLHKISEKIALLGSVSQIMGWDQETYMPTQAIEVRAMQLELLASLLHKKKTSKGFSKALGNLIDLPTGEILEKSLTGAQIAAVRDWRRDYLQTVKLPASFVKSFAKITSRSINIWSKAKEENTFRSFAPYLEKIVALSRKKADLLGYKDHPYDALLDLYEPEMTVAYLTPLFSNLKMHLTELLKAITLAPPVPVDFLHKHYPAEKQLEFSYELLEAMGFDKRTSRLDLTSHPFCSGVHPTDTRMTTRVDPTYLMSNIFSVIHEGGHGLYNMHLKSEHFGSPLGEAASLSIDESQSRWWETRIGRSLPFWQHFFPVLQKKFPAELGPVSVDQFYRAINVVQASLIRTESDEVTYSLHVIVRFELEKALLEGSLKVKELPEAWNEKMRTYLGISPTTDREGCLQDIHWSMGGFGYFPTYTLGNLYASQFFVAFEKNYPEWKERVAKGDLSFIRYWLRDTIHQFGKEFTAAELIQRVSGHPLSEKPFIAYLREKYGKLYSLKL